MSRFSSKNFVGMSSPNLKNMISRKTLASRHFVFFFILQYMYNIVIKSDFPIILLYFQKKFLNAARVMLSLMNVQ